MTALVDPPVPVDEAVAPPIEEPRRGGSPSRNYVVLEEIELADGDTGYVKSAEVDARNGNNALRKAFKLLRETRPDMDEAVLLPIPAGQWKPTPVKAERKESITVAVGG